MRYEYIGLIDIAFLWETTVRMEMSAGGLSVVVLSESMHFYTSSQFPREFHRYKHCCWFSYTLCCFIKMSLTCCIWVQFFKYTFGRKSQCYALKKIWEHAWLIFCNLVTCAITSRSFSFFRWDKSSLKCFTYFYSRCVRWGKIITNVDEYFIWGIRCER